MTERGVGPTELNQLLDAIVTVGSELSLPVVLQRIVETATTLVDAAFGALGVVDESHTRLAQFITVGIDDDEADRIGHLPEGHGILGLLIVEPQPLRLPDLRRHPDSFGFPPHHPVMSSFLGVPIRVRGAVFGNLYLTDKRSAPAFTDADEELVTGLAAAAAMAIENARLHSRVSDLLVLEDRERIARELHDTVIQRIFATGLALQGIAARQADTDLAARLQSAVDDLDDTVRHIRTTIFELQRARLPGRSVRQEVLDLVSESGESLGFDPIVQFEGPIDSVVPAGVADHVLAVVREALTNMAKHAGAGRADVRLKVDDHDLLLRIDDDGRGIDAARTPDEHHGHGLRNLAKRAEQLGGSLTVESAPDEGTTLVWTVPLTD
ncbi:MAG: GAF domain-containing sensor histidine kinase [Acidimicrobiales bacterium]